MLLPKSCDGQGFPDYNRLKYKPLFPENTSDLGV